MKNTKKNADELALLIELYNTTNNLNPIFDWIKDNNKKESKVVSKDFSEEVISLYNLYPTKCPFRGASLGKGTKNKVKIQRLLESYSYSSIAINIGDYLTDCSDSKVYLKNFTTFLNNIEIEEKVEVKDKVVKYLYNGKVSEGLRSEVPSGSAIIG